MKLTSRYLDRARRLTSGNDSMDVNLINRHRNYLIEVIKPLFPSPPNGSFTTFTASVLSFSSFELFSSSRLAEGRTPATNGSN